MAAMLAAVGIKTKYRQIDAATVIDELYTQGNYDIVFANFGPAQSQLDNWKYIKTGWGYDTGGFNFARYANADVDALWQKALDEAMPAKQVESLGSGFDGAFRELPTGNGLPPVRSVRLEQPRSRRLSVPVSAPGSPGVRESLDRQVLSERSSKFEPAGQSMRLPRQFRDS